MHFSFTAKKCAWQVRFYKPCTSSENQFDHASRILCLKSRRASLYNAKVIKMSRLAIDRWLIQWPLRCETDCTTFLSLDMQDNERGQPRCAQNCPQDPCIFFNFAYLFAWLCLKFVVRNWPKSWNRLNGTLLWPVFEPQWAQHKWAISVSPAQVSYLGEPSTSELSRYRQHKHWNVCYKRLIESQSKIMSGSVTVQNEDAWLMSWSPPYTY